MSEPVVSVCMITYNHRPYIEQAIRSVLAQETDFPFELIIGEDCSTDGTREIVLDYQRRYPRIVRAITSEHNVGACANSSRVHKACRGTYIAFCEGDDYWHRTDKLKIQVTYLEARPECGMVCADFDLCEAATGRRVECYNKRTHMDLPPQPDIYGILTRQYRVQTVTVLARRHLMEQIVDADPYLYRESHFLMGDTPRWAEISLVSRIGYVDESLATYARLPESASRSEDPRKLWRFMVSGDEMRLYLCDKHHLAHEVRDRFRRDWFGHSLELAFLEGDLKRAQEVLRQGYQPSRRERMKYISMRSRSLHTCLKGLLSLRRRLVGQRT